MLLTHKDLKRKIEAMESKYDKQFRVVFDTIKQLLETESRPKRKIGFDIKEPSASYGNQTKKVQKGDDSRTTSFYFE